MMTPEIKVKLRNETIGERRINASRNESTAKSALPGRCPFMAAC